MCGHLNNTIGGRETMMIHIEEFSLMSAIEITKHFFLKVESVVFEVYFIISLRKFAEYLEC